MSVQDGSENTHGHGSVPADSRGTLRSCRATDPKDPDREGCKEVGFIGPATISFLESWGNRCSNGK